MKVLAINGSSRKDGNTADMLNLVLGELEKRDTKRNTSSWQAIPSTLAKPVSLVPERRTACSAMIFSKNFTGK